MEHVHCSVCKDRYFSLIIPATKSDVGKVLCSDGSIYATVSEADGIEHIRTDLTGNGFIYNVQGQRVSTPKKGLYIIEGRKIVIK